MAIPAADKPLDASFLRQYAETRGFLLGRPVNPKPAPDGKTVLFLRSGARNPKRSLFEFDCATGKTRELVTAEMLLRGADEQLKGKFDLRYFIIRSYVHKYVLY